MDKRINELIKERKSMEKVFRKKQPMVAAAFCKREKGFAYLAASINGVNRHRYIKKSEEKVWKKLTSEWKKYSTAIAKWVVINKELEILFRRSAKERLMDLPESKGRKKK